MIGRTVANYRIVAEIGTGGMGVVYKGIDLQLERPVALKFLSRARIGADRARARLMREARAASALDHDNLCTIYHVGQDGDVPFIAMAYYEGETLHERLGRERLPPAVAVELTIQAARGLHHAHRHGVIHRDIKPANVMITREGRVKLLDFGIALLRDAAPLTRSDAMVGTVAYMSPEQLSRAAVDHRTDVWSLGIVFYEMLAGISPFHPEQPIANLVQDILQAPIPDVPLDGPAVGGLRSVLRRALTRTVEHRFATAEAMAEALAQLPLLRDDPDHATRPVMVPYRLDADDPDTLDESGMRREARWAAREARVSIAVLQPSDRSREGDHTYLCCGIAEELIRLLTGVDGLRVVARTAALRASSTGTALDALGAQLAVDYVLESSVHTDGDQLRLTARLYDVAQRDYRWSGKYDRRIEDLFTLQDEIAHTLAGALQVNLIGDGQAPHADVPFEAQSLYLHGRYSWNRRTPEAMRQAVRFFRRALSAAPDFALAYAGLADAYTMLGIYGAEAPTEVMPEAKAAAAKALTRDAHLAAVYASRGCVRAVYDWDFAGAADDFRRAVDLDPDHATAHQWHAMHVLIPHGRMREAEVALLRALRLDPLNLPVHSSLGLFHHYARRPTAAIEALRRLLEIDADFVQGHVFLGLVHIARSDGPAALAALQRAQDLAGPRPSIVAALGRAHAVAGQTDIARQCLAEVRAIARERYISPSLWAPLRAALGDVGGALGDLESALRQRSVDLIWLGVDPAYEMLRDQPRFHRLLDALGIGLGETPRSLSA
ncbi:MAG: protein kinase [Acidobacteriota bacterium]